MTEAIVTTSSHQPPAFPQPNEGRPSAATLRSRLWRGKPRTLRFQLLVSVNTALAGLVLAFLVYDTRQAWTDRIEAHRVSLREEAQTLLPAVVRLRHHGREAVQDYLDVVCESMRAHDSPAHQIAIDLGSETLQAHVHAEASPKLFPLRQGGAHSVDAAAHFDTADLIIGAYAQNGIRVYVAESAEHVRSEIWRDVWQQVLQIIVLGLVAAIIVNLVLLRTAVRPLQNLVGLVQRIAAGDLGAQVKPFRTVELNYLAGELNTMSISLAAIEQRRLQQMEKAREVQEHFLPGQTDRPGFQVVPIYEPAEEVAGDYYDIRRTPDGNWLIGIADVTGHGVPAALTVGMLKALLSEAASRWDDVTLIMRFINRHLTELTLPEQFATVALVKVQPDSGTLDYLSAGHESSWLLRQDGHVEELRSSGLIAGILPDADWQVETHSLRTGERLLLVTDGVTEARNPSDDMFGRQRLVEVLQTTGDSTTDQAALQIREAIERFQNNSPALDDLTLLLIELGPTNSAD